MLEVEVEVEIEMALALALAQACCRCPLPWATTTAKKSTGTTSTCISSIYDAQYRRYGGATTTRYRWSRSRAWLLRRRSTRCRFLPSRTSISGTWNTRTFCCSRRTSSLGCSLHSSCPSMGFLRVHRVPQVPQVRQDLEGLLPWVI